MFQKSTLLKEPEQVSKTLLLSSTVAQHNDGEYTGSFAGIDVIFRRGNSTPCLALAYFSALDHARILLPTDLLGPNSDDEIIPKHQRESNLEPETLVKSVAVL